MADEYVGLDIITVLFLAQNPRTSNEGAFSGIISFEIVWVLILQNMAFSCSDEILILGLQ